MIEAFVITWLTGTLLIVTYLEIERYIKNRGK